MTYKIITPPSQEPVTLDEAKAHCQIDGSEFDSQFPGWISAARESAEAETARALCTQTRELVLDAFPESFVLRGAPIQSVVSLKYLDTAGAEQTLDPQDYLLDKDNEPGYVVPAVGKAWPTTYPTINAVRLRYVCGYASAAEVPAAIKHWMKLVIGEFKAQKEIIGDIKMMSVPDRFCHRLLDPHRIYEAI